MVLASLTLVHNAQWAQQIIIFTHFGPANGITLSGAQLISLSSRRQENNSLKLEVRRTNTNLTLVRIHMYGNNYSLEQHPSL